MENNIENKTFNKENLFVAELKYFDGLTRSFFGLEPRSFSVICVKDGEYVNVLNLEDNYSLYKYSHFAAKYCSEQGDMPYLEHVSGEIETGPCYVVTGSLPVYTKDGQVGMETIENFVLNSSEFYKDRATIINKRLENSSRFGNKKLRSLYSEDISKRDMLRDTLDVTNREYGVQLIKK